MGLNYKHKERKKPGNEKPGWQGGLPLDSTAMVTSLSTEAMIE